MKFNIAMLFLGSAFVISLILLTSNVDTVGAKRAKEDVNPYHATEEAYRDPELNLKGDLSDMQTSMKLPISQIKGPHGQQGMKGEKGNTGTPGMTGLSAPSPPKIAFFVGLGEHYGTVLVDTRVVFDRILTNVAGAYDSETGFFRSPFFGTYQFNIVMSTIKRTSNSGIKIKSKILRKSKIRNNRKTRSKIRNSSCTGKIVNSGRGRIRSSFKKQIISSRKDEIISSGNEAMISRGEEKIINSGKGTIIRRGKEKIRSDGEGQIVSSRKIKMTRSGKKEILSNSKQKRKRKRKIRSITSTEKAAVRLMKHGKKVATVWAESDPIWSTSYTVILTLEKDNLVWLMALSNVSHFYRKMFTTFSGVLIFEN